MSDIEIYVNAAIAIDEQFETELSDSALTEEEDALEKMRQALAKRLAYMLQYEAEHLKWVLYRIDVNEQKVLGILANNAIEDATLLMADLIIDRQVQKAITRRQYSKGGGELSFDL